MVVVNDFALESLPGRIHKPDLFDRFFNLFNKRQTEWQENSYRSKLVFGGDALGTTVEGDDLRAQFRHSSGYVLITAYDYFDGAETYIYFLTFDFEIRDEIQVGSLFHPQNGFASDFQIASENQLDFLIYGDDRTWRLTVFAAPRRTFFDCSFGEANRPLKWLLSEHYLKLEIK